MAVQPENCRQLQPYLWEIGRDFRHDMLVPARFYATAEMLPAILAERSLEQLINVATLPGIVRYALAMPDIHQGYGFPIGGVAAINSTNGVVSPGGVGYDINCGVRLLLSQRQYQEIADKIVELAREIERAVPSGVGQRGNLKLSGRELEQVLDQGVNWAVQQGYASSEDQAATEENGYYRAADHNSVSGRAKQRGADQLGTMGAGNHFVEVQEVVEIYAAETANVWGIVPGQVAVMIHTGSRGLGHQVCTDYVRQMGAVMARYQIKLPDRELACAPFTAPEGQNYFRAMAAAANFAWVNRQMITHSVRAAWQAVLGKTEKLTLLYDVAHNIAKLEKYDGEEYVVHRKGATRAFPSGHSALSEHFQKTGQPVLIPGSMGTASYVLVGTEAAMKQTFGSSCHGAGRNMSRTAAKRAVTYEKLMKDLTGQGVVVRAGSRGGLVEEAPQAYKDVDQVVAVVQQSGLAQKVAKLKPLAVIKG